MFDIVSFIPRAVSQGIPLLYGSTGEIITEKTGNLNLGIPGVMYVGAISGVIGSFFYEQSGNMNGFLAITKLGGYIILCSILADYAGLLVKNMPITKCILTGFLEITNGIAAIGNAPIPIDTKLLLTGGMLGFGGVCCTLQTVSILHAAGLSTKKYIYHRIRLCIATILSYLFVIYVL